MSSAFVRLLATPMRRRRGGTDAAANEAWRRYRLISDTARDPDELLAEGIALSQMGIELAASDRPHA